MIAKEIERGGIPLAYITTMSSLALQMSANRIVTGAGIPRPCGDPTLSDEGDLALRLEIVKCALEALQTDVKGPTVFVPDVKFSS